MVLSPSSFSEGLKKSARALSKAHSSTCHSLLKPKMLPKMKHVVIVIHKL
jgi:hypothetical protein